MIKYRLQCKHGHSFESWFGSSDDYDRLSAAKHVSCIVCGSTEVNKALMAPQVSVTDADPKVPAKGPLSAPASPAEQALRALREKVETEAENVGRNFATEARRIHDGDAPERAIYGEAKPEDAKALLDDGIPVAPLPWRSGAKN